MLKMFKTRRWVFHPHSYGIATLLRFGYRRKGGGQILLHHFRPHTETEFHDHPWGFRTFVLWGSYTDESIDSNDVTTVDRLRVGSTRRRLATHAHRTSCKGHVWTLVFTTPKQRSWCKGSPAAWVCGGEVQDFDATRGMVKV